MNTLLALFTTATIQFSLPPGLLASLCFVESKHDITAIHEDDGDSNSVGVCQIKLKTAQWFGFQGTEKDLMRPAVNIYYAAAYLSYQQRRYKGDITKAIIAYNIGNAKGLTQTQYSIKVIGQWQQTIGGLQHER